MIAMSCPPIDGQVSSPLIAETAKNVPDGTYSWVCGAIAPHPTIGAARRSRATESDAISLRAGRIP
jgi:hypothetical protein